MIAEQDLEASINTVPPEDIVEEEEPEEEAVLCWVAREVYGAENPRWMLFREWLLADAPAWFRNLYIARGAAFASWLAPHRALKSMIRRWMDSVIERR